MRELPQEVWPPTCHGRWMSEEYEPGLVSVIVPTYNRACFLAEAMDSVLAQTYRPIELLVIDDGSTDETEQLVADWRQKTAADPQFTLRYFKQPNRGAPAARNLGLIESHGEFIQFLDSDDILHPKRLAVQTDALRKSASCDCVVSDCVRISDPGDGKWLATALASAGDGTDGFAISKLKTLPPQACFCLYRRTACTRIGPWNESLVRNQDWEYTLRFLCLDPQAGYVRGALYAVRTHDRGRINDLRKRPDRGVPGNLHAAKAAEAVVCATDTANGGVRLRLAQHYFVTAVWAMRARRRHDARAALAGAYRQANSNMACRIKARTAMFLVNTLGCRVTLSLYTLAALRRTIRWRKNRPYVSAATPPFAFGCMAAEADMREGCAPGGGLPEAPSWRPTA